MAVPEAADLFEAGEVLGETETIEESADHNIALVRTTSGYFRIDEARRPAFEADVRRLFDRFGGTARFTLMTLLVTAARAA